MIWPTFFFYIYNISKGLPKRNHAKQTCQMCCFLPGFSVNNFTTAGCAYLHQSLKYFMRIWGLSASHCECRMQNWQGDLFHSWHKYLFNRILLFFPLTVCGKFNNFSLHNLTETQWPWHVAVYIRLPPDAPSTVRPPGTAMLVQQGDSEESTFWVLACSGALLSQRSILVAAQCVVDGDEQTRQPAHMRVTMGMHDQRKSLRRLVVAHDLHIRPSPLSAQSLWICRKHVVYIIFKQTSTFDFKSHLKNISHYYRV